MVETKDKNVEITPSDSPRELSFKIQYNPSLEAAEALARHSERCTQHIEFGCRRAKLLGDKLGAWVSADGVYQYYWGGAQPESQSCACGETKSCLDPNKKCNCDAARDIWTKDEGVLNSTTLLPVEEVLFKEIVKPGEANFTVGNLYCSGV